MNRLSVRLTTIIDLISLLTLGLEFFIIYYCANTVLSLVIISFILILCTSIFIRTSKSFDSGFLYSFILVLFSSCIIGFIYMNGDTFSLEYSQKLLILILLNWLMPMICSILHDLHDSREQYAHFTSFFNKSTTQFIIYYIGFLALIIVIKPITLPCISDTMWQSINQDSYRNVIPFYRIACYIEDSIYNQTDISPLIQYIFVSILITLPYGFYISLLFKNKGHILRLFLLFLLPIVMEVCKQYIAHEVADVEHILLGVLGGLVGSSFFFLLNSRYYHLKRHEFLEGRKHFNW